MGRTHPWPAAAPTLLAVVAWFALLLHWLMYRHAGSLALQAPFQWSLYPILYLGYALVRGKILGTYPYPFIDAATLGYPRVLLNGIGLLIAFLVLGFAVLGLARITHKKRGP